MPLQVQAKRKTAAAICFWLPTPEAKGIGNGGCSPMQTPSTKCSTAAIIKANIFAEPATMSPTRPWQTWPMRARFPTTALPSCQTNRSRHRLRWRRDGSLQRIHRLYHTDRQQLRLQNHRRVHSDRWCNGSDFRVRFASLAQLCAAANHESDSLRIMEQRDGQCARNR